MIKPLFTKPPSVMTSVELATAVVDNHDAVKMVLAEFDRGAAREPDAEAAELVVRAFGEGRIAPYWAAALLGRIGHPSGYATVLAILGAPSQQNTSCYAEEAVARLAGPRCASDLVPWLTDGDRPDDVRYAAARALGLAGAREALPVLCQEAGGGRIAYRSARTALVDLDVGDDVTAAWLRSERGSVVRLGCGVIFERLERKEERSWSRAARSPGRELAPLVAAACAREDVPLLGNEREALRAWAG